MENDKYYLTLAKYETLIKEIHYLEKGEGSDLLEFARASCGLAMLVERRGLARSLADPRVSANV